jgi:hypothetical protein
VLAPIPQLHLRVYLQLSTHNLQPLIARNRQVFKELARMHLPTQSLPVLELVQVSTFWRLQKFLDVKYQRHLPELISRVQRLGMYFLHLMAKAQKHSGHLHLE